MTRLRVAIVGGGLAGMSAALALREQKSNLDITIFETKRCTGGRAGSFIDSKTGENVDYCQHVAMGCCTNLLNMMSSVDCTVAALARVRVGHDSETRVLANRSYERISSATCSNDAFTRYRELSFRHPAYPPARFAKSRLLPAPLHLLPSLLRLPYLTWKQKFEISRATFALMRTKPNEHTNISANDWLVEQKQSTNTIRDYWDVVVASALGESCQHVSMAAARKVFIDGFLANRDASDLLLPKLPLSTLFGEVLPKAIVRQGVTLQTGMKVRSVTMTSDQRMKVEFDDETSTFDHLVLAVPWFAISKILDQDTAIAAGLPADRYANVPCSPITGIHLWFDRSILNQPHAVLVGTLAQWVFRRETDKQTELKNRHYVQVVISASHGLRQMNSDQLIEQIVSELRQIFPNAAAATLVRSRVVTDPQAVFSLRPEVDAMRPGSQTKLRSLHLAGDFVQTGWPATMEGAVISGRMAASSLLVALGCEPVAIDPGLPPSLLASWLIRY